MAGGEKDGFSIFSLLFFFLLLLFPAIGAENVTFTPPDLYLLDCGSPKSLQLPDGRTFRSEPQSSSFLSTDEDIRLSSSSPVSFPVSALYLTARVFSGASTYSFYISKLGLHFLRLHFFPFPSPSYNLSSAIFTVSTQDFVLLRDFSLPTSPLIKEYLIDAKTERLCIIFKPSRGSFAFINALEVVSAPDSLIPTAAAALSPQEPFSGINNYALELVARINAGGGQISPENDPLARSWLPDSFLTPPQAAKSVAVSPEKVRYPADGSVTPLVAPRSVYATADTMASSNASQPLFNVTWQIPVIGEYSYLIRLHFCDIVSRSPNSLYFNVFINGILAIPNLDLSSLTGGNLAMAYCKDFVVQGFAVISGTISVQISPPVMNDPGLPNAILNGIEVMKMSNRAGSLDGPYSVDGSYHGASKRHVTVVVVGLILGAVGLALVVFMFVRWQRMRKVQSLAVWLSPLTACTKGPPEFAGRWSRKESSLCSSSKNGAWKKGFGSQHKSKSGYTSFLASGGLGLGR